jgi:hypothetical protein
MPYLPVYCEACCRASMAAAGEKQPLCCAFCEAVSRVIPGPIYSDDDWLAFAELDAAVFDAALDGARASALAEEIQQLLLSSPSQADGVTLILQRLPSLAAARPALINRWPRGPRILATLLMARSRDPALTREGAGSPTTPGPVG